MIRQQKRKAVLARYLHQEFVHVKINLHVTLVLILTNTLYTKC